MHMLDRSWHTITGIRQREPNNILTFVATRQRDAFSNGWEYNTQSAQLLSVVSINSDERGYTH